MGNGYINHYSTGFWKFLPVFRKNSCFFAYCIAECVSIVLTYNHAMTVVCCLRLFPFLVPPVPGCVSTVSLVVCSPRSIVPVWLHCSRAWLPGCAAPVFPLPAPCLPGLGLLPAGDSCDELTAWGIPPSTLPTKKVNFKFHLDKLLEYLYNCNH